MEEDLSNFVKFFCITLYTDLSDDDKPYLADSLENMLISSPSSSLKSIEGLSNYLQSRVAEIRAHKSFKKFKENEAYQKALQQLDSEVRTHIKQEFELKLFLDDLKSNFRSQAVAEVLNTSEHLSILIETKEKLLDLISMKETELRGLQFCGPETDELELRLLKENVEDQREEIRKGVIEIEKIQTDCEGFKIEIESLKKDCEELRKKNSGLRNVYDNCLYDVVNKSCIRTSKKLSPIRANVEEKLRKISRVYNSTKRLRNPVEKTMKVKVKPNIRLKMYVPKT